MVLACQMNMTFSTFSCCSAEGPKLHFHDSFPLHLNVSYILIYYALNKLLNSDCLNTNLTLVDVWLVGSNVGQRNLISGW